MYTQNQFYCLKNMNLEDLDNIPDRNALHYVMRHENERLMDGAEGRDIVPSIDYVQQDDQQLQDHDCHSSPMDGCEGCAYENEGDGVLTRQQHNEALDNDPGLWPERL